MSALINLAAEQAVIAGALMRPDLIDLLADDVSPADFSEPFFGDVFGLILREHAKGQPLNPVTIKPLLNGDVRLEQIGGAAWLAGLAGESASIVAARPCAKQLHELADKRRLVAALTEIIVNAEDPEHSAIALAADVDAATSAVCDRIGEAGELTGAAALDLALKAMDSPQRGVLCHRIPSLDRLMGPMRGGDFVVMAGRPGMGKTALALSYSLGVAESGQGVLFVSLEMGATQLAERMAADLCFDANEVPYSAIRDGVLNQDQARAVMAARDRLAKMPFQIVDRSSLTIARLRRLVKRWSRRFEAQGIKLGLVVVDYLQLLRVDGTRDRFEAVSEISRTLKELAKENGVPVLGLAQLSREVEKRADKRPQLSDLRESGQIEQDADVVLFLLRAEYYLRQQEATAAVTSALSQCAGKVELILAKRRNGPSGSAFADFNLQFQAIR